MASIMVSQSLFMNSGQLKINSSSLRVVSRASPLASRNMRLKVSAKKSTFKAAEDQDKMEEPEKFGMAGLSQLVKMGLGTISGDIKEINLDDPARTVVMELEANNLEDDKGDVAKGEYFEDGWVDESDSSGGFWGKLFGKKDD